MFPYNVNSWSDMGPFHMNASVIMLFIIWSIVWKGLVLWTTARRGHTGWFIFFLIVNTLGIGEIIYMLVTNGFDEVKKKK